MRFIRFGGLSPQWQKHYTTENKSFHNPPVRKGFYAFPWPHVEKFLLIYTERSNKFSWIRDEEGRILCFQNTSDELFYSWFDKKKWEVDGELDSPRIRNLFKRKKIKPGEKGVRVKYDASSGESRFYYLKPPKIFHYHDEIWHHLEKNVRPSDVISRTEWWVLTDIRSYKAALQTAVKEDRAHGTHYSKDHYEVFIQKIK